MGDRKYFDTPHGGIYSEIFFYDRMHREVDEKMQSGLL